MWLTLSSFDRISHLGTSSVSLKWWLWKPSRNLLWLPDSIKSLVWVYQMQFRPSWLLIAAQHCVSSLSNCCSLIKPDRPWTFFSLLLLLCTAKGFVFRTWMRGAIDDCKAIPFTCGRTSPFPSETFPDNIWSSFVPRVCRRTRQEGRCFSPEATSSGH